MGFLLRTEIRIERNNYMNTKEAIEFCGELKRSCDVPKHFIPEEHYRPLFSNLDKVDQLVALLKQGEAYKKIVGVLENIHCVGEDFEDGETSYKRRKLVESLKQKYFPKGNIEEVVNGITEQIKESAEIAKKEMKTNETEVD